MAPRIPPLPESDWDQRARELLAPMRRGGRADGAVLNIFTTLVRHPDLLSEWLNLGRFLLGRGVLPATDRELVIMRTAWNCQAEYEWGQHLRIATRVGVAADELQRIPAGPDAPGWTSHQVALLRAADELHRDSRIAAGTWTELARTYDQRQLIELTVLVGQYHLVAFALNSAGVEREPGVAGFSEGGE